MLFVFLVCSLVLGVSSQGQDTCRELEDTGFYDQAFNDFSALSGDPEYDFELAKGVCEHALQSACFVIQIINNQLYVAPPSYEGFQSRFRITLIQLQNVVNKLGPLPDCQFVIDIGDGLFTINAPIFLMSKGKFSNKILFKIEEI